MTRLCGSYAPSTGLPCTHPVAQAHRPAGHPCPPAAGAGDGAAAPQATAAAGVGEIAELLDAHDVLQEKAWAVAVAAHGGQTEAAGNPYTDHLRRVAARLDDSAARAVALLHDTLEDTDLSHEALATAFGEEIARAVEILTRRPAQTYAEYIEGLRTSGSDVAIAVKIADLEDHLRPESAAYLDGHPGLRARYLKALEALGA